jgi:hypothetical protein
MAVKYLDDLHASGSIYFDEVATDGNVGSTTGYSMLVIEDSTSKIRSAVIPSGGGGSTPSLQAVTDVGTTTTNVISFGNDVHVDGLLGVGTSLPIYKFHIVGDNTSNNTDSFVFENSNGTDSLKWSNAGQLEVTTDNTNALVFKRSNGQALVSLRSDNTNGNNGYVQYLRNGSSRFSQGTYRDGSNDDYFGLTADTTVNSSGNFIVSFSHSDGKMILHNYGSGNMTGSPGYLLAVDGSGMIVESTQSIPNLAKGVTTTTTNSSGNVVLSHSLGDAPSGVSIQMTASIVGAYSTPHAIATVTARTSSNITINFKDWRGTSVNSTSVSFSYILIA